MTHHRTTVTELRPYRALADVAAAFDAAGEPMILLDSQTDGRYSILGVNPFRQLLQYGDAVHESQYGPNAWRHKVHPHADALDTIRSWSAQSRRHDDASTHDACRTGNEPSPSESPPFTSGVMGFLSYNDCLRRHGIRPRHTTGGRRTMPDAAWWDFDDVLIEDRRDHRTLLVSHHRRGGHGSIPAIWRSPASTGSVWTSRPDEAVWTCDHDRTSYVRGVEHLRDHMRDGDAYVANYSLRMTVTSPTTPLELFLRLARSNPAPFAGYVNGGDWQIVSSSPERFLRCRDGHVVTEPIKGTRPRDADPARDRRNRAELERSGKDHGELLMVTDLERNDLSRVCIPGTLTTPAFAEIHSFAHVHHLISTVEADLSPRHMVEDAIEAMSPGGSITGAPKLRVMQLIDRYERSARGAYTGSLGYVGFDGDCDLNILIRSATHAGPSDRGGEYIIGAGGGITIESDPDAEYDEAMQKAEALLDALGCDTKGRWHD